MCEGERRKVEVAETLKKRKAKCLSGSDSLTTEFFSRFSGQESNICYQTCVDIYLKQDIYNRPRKRHNVPIT